MLLRKLSPGLIEFSVNVGQVIGGVTFLNDVVVAQVAFAINTVSLKKCKRIENKNLIKLKNKGYSIVIFTIMDFPTQTFKKNTLPTQPMYIFNVFIHNKFENYDSVKSVKICRTYSLSFFGL